MSILEQLRTAGFTEYEARAYIGLVRGGGMTARELSRASGVPYSKIYEVVSKLERKGLVEVQKARPMIFRAVSPRNGLQRYRNEYLKGMEMEFSMKRRSLEEAYKERMSQVSEALVKASKTLQALFEDGGELDASDDLIWTIRNRENVVSQMRELILSASNVKMILAKELIVHLERAILKTNAKGEIITKAGATAGISAQRNMRFYLIESIPFKCNVIIADDTKTIFTSENFETAFKSSNQGLATILTLFFEHEKEEAVLDHRRP